MTSLQTNAIAARQVPSPGRVYVDHIAYFVPDRDAVHAALVSLGFAPTPFSLQRHRLETNAPLTPAGTGNHCVMLRDGYLEFLVPVAETPVAVQLRRWIERYVGAHSIVFGSYDVGQDQQRLQAQGFAPLPEIALERPIGTAAGEQTARFSVLRVPPQAMPEGRIQFCRHHTPEHLWQSRWLEHPNGATGLGGVIVCVADVDEAVHRFARFSGVPPKLDGAQPEIRTDRGRIRFVDEARCEELFGMRAPSLPWIVACELASADLAATRRTLERGGYAPRSAADGSLIVRAPASVGGALIFSAEAA